MNIVYPSDFGDIEIENEHKRKQAEHLSRHTIVLERFFEEKNLPKDHTTSTKEVALKKLYQGFVEFRQIMENGMYVSVGD